MKKIIFIIISVIFLTGCTTKDSEILTEQNADFRKISQEVTEIKKSDLDFIEKMKSISDQYNLNGLAAPQMGQYKRIIILRMKDDYIVLINPKILKSEGSTIAIENSVSIPGLNAVVKRSEKIQIEYTDIEKRKQTMRAEKQLSRNAIQLIDYLNGILLYDAAEHVFYKE